MSTHPPAIVPGTPRRPVGRGLGLVLLGALGAMGCGIAPDEDFEDEPFQDATSVEQGLVTCGTRQDTGYRSGTAFTITVVTADGKPVERDTANAYAVMQQAAAAAGVYLAVSSGFRTMSEQQYFYACYTNCNCNSCNLAARPGYSNHQSGHALDLNTSAPGVLNWLTAHGGSFGFSRTVPSEAWHWEWWGGGPGGGPCVDAPVLTPENCTEAEASGCGQFGCHCVDHQCNGTFCAGSGCTAQEQANCGAYGCGCVDGACAGGTCAGGGCTAKESLDCSKVGCGCVDHQCNGGAACVGTGCTWRETHDCGGFGVNCADHQCSGGFGPGNGCTAKETADCTAKSCGCVDHACSGGSACPGTGCTAKQALTCEGQDAGCALAACVARAPDAGRPPASQPPDAGPPGGADPTAEVESPPAVLPAPSGAGTPGSTSGLGPATGSCASAPAGAQLLALALLAVLRRRGS